MLKRTQCAVTVALAGLVMLSGCSVQGDIKPADASKSEFDDAFYQGTEFQVDTNPEGYKEWRIFSQGATGFVPQSAVRNNAVKRAQSFCRKEGQDVRVLTEHWASGAKVFGNFPRVELVFVCVPEGAESRASDQRSQKAARQAATERAPIDADKSRYDRLEQLGRLHSSGVLTDEEFKAEKARLLK